MTNAFENVSKTGKEFVETAVKSTTAVTKSLQAIAAEATDFTRSSIENGSSHFEKLAATKSLDQVFELQNNFAKQAYEAFVAQAGKMSELYADLAKEAYKPFEMIAVKTSK